jgi:hypothetical protein
MLGFFESHNKTSWSQTNRDPSFTNSGLTCISGGGATFTYVSAFTAQKLPPNQKIYFEVILNTYVDGGWGIGNQNALTTTFTGGDINGAGIYFNSGTGEWTYNGGVSATALGGVATGDNVSFAYDGINALMWARYNGGNWINDILANQNPATATGGLSIPGVYSGATYILIGMVSQTQTVQSYTLNAGSTAFVYTPPLGFRSPDSSAAK